jgi:hypothetical protein
MVLGQQPMKIGGARSVRDWVLICGGGLLRRGSAGELTLIHSFSFGPVIAFIRDLSRFVTAQPICTSVIGDLELVQPPDLSRPSGMIPAFRESLHNPCGEGMARIYDAELYVLHDGPTALAIFLLAVLIAPFDRNSLLAHSIAVAAVSWIGSLMQFCASAAYGGRVHLHADLVLLVVLGLFRFRESYQYLGSEKPKNPSCPVGNFGMGLNRRGFCHSPYGEILKGWLLLCNPNSNATSSFRKHCERTPFRHAKKGLEDHPPSGYTYNSYNSQASVHCGLTRSA